MHLPLLLLSLRVAVSLESTPLDPAQAERFARLALDCVHREYPNKIAHVLEGEADVRPPRQLTPVFYGCYDWHSSVHGHWLLARLARLLPQAPFAREARAALARSLKPEAIAVEVQYFEGKGRVSFERPYGLAWLLQLAAELREWPDREAQTWSRALAPLEKTVAARLKSWLPKLAYPIRVGEHCPDRLCLRAGARLGAEQRRHRDGRPDRVARAGLLPEGSRLPLCTTSPRARTSSRPAWPRPT